MAKRRTLLVLKAGDPPEGGGLLPLGSLAEVRVILSRHNLSPDGAGPQGLGERLGAGIFHGPGMVMEISVDPDLKDPEIKQILVGVTDDDFAWPVLSRLCKTNGFKLMDPDSGRTFMG